MLEDVRQSLAPLRIPEPVARRIAELNRHEGKTDPIVLAILRRVERARSTLKPDSFELRNVLIDSGKELLQLKQFPRAHLMIRDSLAISEMLNPNWWGTAEARALYGYTLFGLDRLAEAEPYMANGYRDLLSAAPEIPERYKYMLTDAGVRLVQLYEATNRLEKAAAIRASLPTPPNPRTRSAVTAAAIATDTIAGITASRSATSATGTSIELTTIATTRNAQPAPWNDGATTPRPSVSAPVDRRHSRSGSRSGIP